jgi:hypothetical protein
VERTPDRIEVFDAFKKEGLGEDNKIRKDF